MITRKPKRRPIRADDLSTLQQLLDQAAARDAAENPTTSKKEDDDAR
jgi:hypothetical protein